MWANRQHLGHDSMAQCSHLNAILNVGGPNSNETMLLTICA